MEKTKMQKIITFALALSLFGSITVFADGNQGQTGNTNDCKNPDDCPPAVCTNGCPAPRVEVFTGDDITTWSYVEDIYIDVTKGALENVLF
jgi:hypothetical protein